MTDEGVVRFRDSESGRDYYAVNTGRRHRITKPRRETLIGWTVTIERFYYANPEAVPSHPNHYDHWEIDGRVWGLTQRRATQRAQRRVAESNREWAEWERLRSEPRIELDERGLPDMRGAAE